MTADRAAAVVESGPAREHRRLCGAARREASMTADRAAALVESGRRANIDACAGPRGGRRP
jgi:hypothetical protein